MPAKKKEDRKLKQKECMRKLREERKNRPLENEEAKRKERERYHRRKAEGKIKLVAQMTAREKRLQQKKWREKSKKSYDLKKAQTRGVDYFEENAPPPTPSNALENVNLRDGRMSSGKKRRRKTLSTLHSKIKALQSKLKMVENKRDKYKMRLKRLEQKQIQETPQKNVQKLLRGQRVSKIIKRKLLFGEVLKKQIKENYKSLKSPRDKQLVWNSLNGQVILKYRYIKDIKKITSNSYVGQRGKLDKRRHKKAVGVLKEIVTEYLEKDENSRLCAGKKETVTQKKIKVQKRYLNDTLQNLYKKFKKENPKVKMSYSLFCKLRPFWILSPKACSRDTCLCITHTNFNFIVKKLKQMEVIRENSDNDVVRHLCCSKEDNYDCLKRQCKNCKDYKIKMNVSHYDESDVVEVERWITKKVLKQFKGEQKISQRTIKEKITLKVKDLIINFKKEIPVFIKHVSNIAHQFKIIKDIKEELKEGDILIHMDFSQNYTCKYGSEVQAAHFGSSKPQVSLHTVVVYFNDNGNTKPLSFCTISDSLRHDPSAVCAHLNPIIDYMLQKLPYLHNVHFFSDGPTTQYRNKSMFFLLAKYLSSRLRAECIRWHYSEKGHGKGAPDGIGGYLKRAADKLVATGEDIPNSRVFYEKLKNHSSIQVIYVDAKDINSIDAFLPIDLDTFKGTLKIHEVTWTKNCSALQVRELTCRECSPDKKCKHFGLGEIPLNTISSILFFELFFVLILNIAYMILSISFL